MNPYELVFLHRKCGKCGNEVPQLVFFSMEKDEIKLGIYWKHCMVDRSIDPPQADQ